MSHVARPSVLPCIKMNQILFIQHFATSNDWFDHSNAQHTEHWVCFPFCCRRSCSQARVFYAHIGRQHKSSHNIDVLFSVSICCTSHTASMPHVLCCLHKSNRRRQTHRKYTYKVSFSSSYTSSPLSFSHGPSQSISNDQNNNMNVAACSSLLRECVPFETHFGAAQG